MQHLDFVVWMLGFPIVTAVETLIMSRVSGKYAEPDGAAPLIAITIWFYIGYLLW